MKKKNVKKINPFVYLIIILIIVLMALVVTFSLRTYHQYVLFKQHDHYFREGNSQIQPWMNIHALEKRFNISQDALAEQLNISSSKIAPTSILSSLCSQYNLNCTKVVIELDRLKQ